ncbi:hypothetical protein O988_02848 [Pseudogymnoascus sp. VKM F-3808]|nr:hypothetical protein O988_02848 [Pseudogymnoascus sp. VKM F-3808]
MRAAIVLTALILLTPSLAAVTCDSTPYNTRMCCPEDDESFYRCTAPSEVPEEFSDFERLCNVGPDDDKVPYCCSLNEVSCLFVAAWGRG